MQALGLQEGFELFNSQTRIANDATHRERVDWIMARNGDDARTVAHHDMFALPHDSESCLFECAHRIEMIDPS